MIEYSIRINMQGERVQYENIVFTTGDKRGYRLNFAFYSGGSRMDVSGYALAVKARRADGEVILDSGVTEEKGAYYIVADNAYNVEGLLEFEVALVGPDESLATVHVIRTQVREGFGEAGLAPEDATPILAKAAAATERATTAAENADQATQNVTEAKNLAEAAAENADKKAVLAEEKATEAVQATEAANVAEQARKVAEEARTAAENTRVDAESSRVAAETQRTEAETARANAESARVAAETQRNDNETVRVENEAGRTQAEAKRAAAEQARAEAEIERDNNEVVRKDTEIQRIASENARLDAEIARDAAEKARNEAEMARKNAETERIAAEAVRQSAFTESYNNVSNAFTGTASGACVRMDAVSPLVHQPQITVKSMNLFNIQSVTAIGQTPITITENSITIHPFSTNYGFAYIAKNIDGLDYILEAGKTYTLSVKTDYNGAYADSGSSRSWGWRLLNEDGTWLDMNNSPTLTITPNQNIANCYFYVTMGGETTEDIVISDIQIEEGAEATLYTPYVAPESVGFTCYGRNLWHHDSLTCNASSGLTKTATGFSWVRPEDFTAGAYVCANKIEIPKGTTITFSAEGIKNVHLYLYKDKVYGTKLASAAGTRVSYTATERVAVLPAIIIDSLFNVSGAENIQVEIGDAVTDYAPFVTPANFAGAENVTSISPDMTLLPNRDGVMLEVTYNRDSNKILENITNAIISLGGNI